MMNNLYSLRDCRATLHCALGQNLSHTMSLLPLWLSLPFQLNILEEKRSITYAGDTDSDDTKHISQNEKLVRLIMPLNKVMMMIQGMMRLERGE